MRRRYWTVSKEMATGNVRSAIEQIGDLLSQESDQLFDDDMIEVENQSMISFPPHFIATVHALKLLKDLEKSIENDEFRSFTDNK